MEHQKETMHKNHAGHDMSQMPHDAPMTHEGHDMSQMHHDGNPAMGHAGHNHHTMMIADFKKRFYIVLALTIPIVLLSPMIQQFMGINWQFTGSSYILFGLSTIVYFYGGWPFLKGLVDEVKAKNPGMMFLIGFAITVAYIYSVAVVFGLQGMDFFWELSTLILIMLFRALDRNEIGYGRFKRTGITGTTHAFRST